MLKALALTVRVDMHTPSKFNETNMDKLYEFIQEYPLGTLITSVEDCVNADHVPFYLNTKDSEQVRLQSHIAKANPLWRTCPEGQEVLLIFHGPNTYISPNLYPSKQETGRAVPTWNYSVVHVRGRIHFKHDRDWTVELLSEISALHEQHQESPWSLSDAPEQFIENMVNGVIGFEIVIEDITGNFKLSQNKTSSDYAGVVKGLENSKRGADIAVAKQMKNNQ